MSGGTIGIIGGMGPLATADLFQKIIRHTDARCDQEHLHILIDNNTAIPDRTAALLHGGADPFPEMCRSAKFLEAGGADCLIMPCNTAHFYHRRLQEQLRIPLLHMVELTCMIYQGVKAGRRTYDTGAVHRAVRRLIDGQGAQTVVLGCTELPLAAEMYQIQIPHVDPTLELAKAAIRQVGGVLCD